MDRDAQLQKPFLSWETKTSQKLSMELALGAMAGLATKLAGLLKDEYVLQRGLKSDIKSLSRELPMMHAALAEVSCVPPDQLHEVDRLWARHVRELSYDMEDAIDAFTAQIMDSKPASSTDSDDSKILKNIASKVTKMMNKVKDRHQISNKIKDIKSLSKELSDLRNRWKFEGAAANPAANTRIDPRVLNLYKNEAELVGIDEPRDYLIRRLTESHASSQKLKIITITGMPGLGKTTLAKTVHDRLKRRFDCWAFVSVGRNPNMARTFKKMLEQLDENYKKADMATWDVQEFCEELKKFLHDKRYFIAVDDIWDKNSWKTFRYALEDNNHGSIIIVTTRNSDVVKKADRDIYELKPLSQEKSKELFYKRMFGGEGGFLDSQFPEASDKILGKCGGVPLAIIAIASLFAERPWEEWSKVYYSIIFELEDSSTGSIFLYSYYDLPSYLKPCLLHLSILPEDCTIQKNPLIWSWVAEGFIQTKEGDYNLFEIGEGYFNELVNRSMIIPVENEVDRRIDRCCVHDIVLELIHKLSKEENFITMLVGDKCPSLGSAREKIETNMPHMDRKVRRLALQNCHFEHIPQDTMSVPEAVRSVDISFSKIQNMPPLSSFKVCRVLSLEHSHTPKLKDLGKLQHLRYLMINTTHVDDELLSEIGDLKSLKTLILRDSGLDNLPSAICVLTQLMCLRVVGTKMVSTDRIGNLVSLEELVLDPIVGSSRTHDLAVQLSMLTRLRVIEIKFAEKLEESSHKAFVQSLRCLLKIKDLKLSCDKRMRAVDTWEEWEPPRQIWRISLECIEFSCLPSWINSPVLLHLCYLDLFVEVVEVRDLEKLARVPDLLYFRLRGRSITQGYNVDADGFKNLRVCRVDTTFKFLPGAMPRLQTLDMTVNLGDDINHTNNGVHIDVPQTRDAIADLDFGLENLISLEEAIIYMKCTRASPTEVEEAEAVVKRAVVVHPNRPTVQTKRLNENSMLSAQDMQPIQRADVVVRGLMDLDAYGHCRACLACIFRCFRRLQAFHIRMDCEGAKHCQVEELESAYAHAADVHPNQPTITLSRINSDKMISCKDCQTINNDSGS